MNKIVDQIEDVYMTAAQVKTFFGGITTMALWRWGHDEKLDFPVPHMISKRQYWKKSDILAFRDRMAREAIEKRNRPSGLVRRVGAK